jgi:hypothetical protein
VVINLAVVGTAILSIATGDPVAYEWLLIAVLSRPMYAFTLVLAEVSTD